jgi:hypothetical protein
MGRQSKWEYFRAVYVRYRRADRRTKQGILDECCANTRYHRKYALRLLNGPPPGRARPRSPRHPRRPTYGASLVSVLRGIWKAAGQVSRRATRLRSKRSLKHRQRRENDCRHDLH